MTSFDNSSDFDATLDLPLSGEPGKSGSTRLREGPGTIIGPYKILQLIGEGGFGSVFMAQQEKPVQRKIALKIIKLGMDTHQVVARFEQERQALAVMDHPNIAKVLDAGATETGRPYFVMDLVKGEPIVEYCDRNHLGIRERLELFVQVCSAVQHAHTKGIIHRDIKPSNILVSDQDGSPSPKVIDFGIAKATSARLTDKTLVTEHRQLIGTPEYMSPEQAEGLMDIDTRTDVYSLGVVLYELLTGFTPFDSDNLRSAAYAEIQRVFREVEPPRPSTRLSRSADTLVGIAAKRDIEPRRLSTTIRGDLDWIVMKAIEKDRARRYETANGLAADIRRYLAGEPVVAAPPGAAYRVRKFIKRNRVTVSAAAAVAAALLIGVVGFAWQAKVATDQRDRAITAEAETKKRADQLKQVSDFQANMLSQIDATDAGEKLIADMKERFGKALETGGVPQDQCTSRGAQFARELGEVNATDAAAAMIDRTILKPSIAAIDEKFKDQPEVDASLRHTLANLYRSLGLYEPAIALQKQAVETRRRILGDDAPSTLSSQTLMAEILTECGKMEESTVLLRETLDRSIRVRGSEDAETLRLEGDLGNALRAQGKFAEAEPLLRTALDGKRRVLGDTSPETLASLNTYGYLMIAQGKVAETEPYWREAYETGKRVLGPNNSDTLIWTANMGGLMTELGRWEDAANFYSEASEGFRRVKGEEHPNTLACLNSLGFALGRQGKLEEAEKIIVRVLEAQRRTLGEDHPDTLDSMSKLGGNLRDQGRFPEAEAQLRLALANRKRILGPENIATLDGMSLLAGTLSDAEKYEESNALYTEQLGIAERVVGKEHNVYTIACVTFGMSLTDQRRFEEAEPYLRLAAETRRRISGSRHVETGNALRALGIMLHDQGRAAEAEPVLRESLEIYRATMNKSNPRIFVAVKDLADVLLTEGKVDQAEPMCREALESLDRLSGKDSVRASGARKTMGRLLTARKKFEEAQRELLESYRVISTGKGVNSRSIQRFAQALAELYSAWDSSEPGKGYEGKAAEWKAKALPAK